MLFWWPLYLFIIIHYSYHNDIKYNIFMLHDSVQQKFGLHWKHTSRTKGLCLHTFFYSTSTLVHLFSTFTFWKTKLKISRHWTYEYEANVGVLSFLSLLWIDFVAASSNIPGFLKKLIFLLVIISAYKNGFNSSVTRRISILLHKLHWCCHVCSYLKTG